MCEGCESYSKCTYAWKNSKKDSILPKIEIKNRI